MQMWGRVRRHSFVSLLCLLVSVVAARAQEERGPFDDALDRVEALRQGKMRMDWAFKGPPEPLKSKDGKYELTVDITPFNHIIEGKTLRLRSYNNKSVGPTIRVKPGETFCINLHNRMPSEDVAKEQSHDEPGEFDVTNLHTHGLAVSPEPPADDVIHTDVRPNSSFSYSYNIPSDHPGGTYWYHPHRHRSAGLQLANGMAGALIVDPLPDANRPSLDAYLEKGLGKKPRERILVFQEIMCGDKDTPTKRSVYDSAEPGRFLVNGVYLPVIQINYGEVERWRCIHAGVSRPLGLIVAQPLDKGGYKALGLRCIAADGMTLPAVKTQTFKPDLTMDDPDLFSLLPGERADFLIQGEAPDTVYLLLAPFDNEYGTSDELKQGSIPLAIVCVKNNHVDNAALEAAKNRLEALKKLPGWRPEGLADGNCKTRRIQFRASGGNRQFRWMMGEDGDIDKVKWQTFGAVSDFYVDAGTREKWILESVRDDHPFHVHVNPFWTLSRQEERQIPREIKHWYDTVFVPAKTKVTILIEFNENLPGKTVFHCHNLNHEDHGMMAAFEIRKKQPGDRKQLGTRPATPAPAPHFRLPATDGNHHELGHFADKKLLLVFVRGLGCTHCLTQLRMLACRHHELSKAGLTIVAISPEPPTAIAETLKSLPGEDALPFPILSGHADKDVFKRYGCHAEGAPLHGTFVIDKGRVHWQHIGEQPFMDIYGMLDEVQQTNR